MLLVGPGGQKVMLMSDASGNLAVSNATVTFDAAAANAVPQTTAIATVPIGQRIIPLGGTTDNFTLRQRPAQRLASDSLSG